MSLKEEVKELDWLCNVQSFITKSAAKLRDNSFLEGADKMDEAAEVIGNIIDRLMGRLLSDWKLLAIELELELKPIMYDLKDQMSDIEKDIKLAKNIVKAVGTVDKLAKKVIEKLSV